MRLELGPRLDDGDLRIDGVDAAGAEAVAQVLEGQPQLEAGPDIGDVGADVAEAGGVAAGEPELAIVDAEQGVADRRAAATTAGLPGAAQVLDDEVAIGVEADGVGDEGVGQRPSPSPSSSPTASSLDAS